MTDLHVVNRSLIFVIARITDPDLYRDVSQRPLICVLPSSCRVNALVLYLTTKSVSPLLGRIAR